MRLSTPSAIPKCKPTSSRSPACSRSAIQGKVRRLSRDRRTFPWIAEREQAGDLELVGLHFGIADGVLRRMQTDGLFQALEPAE